MRTLLALISFTLLLTAGASAQDAAASFPNKPIKIVVCVPAGGGVDTVTRIVAEGLHQQLGQPVVVENRAGAAGNIGAEYVFTSEPGRIHAARRPAGAVDRQSAALQEAEFRPHPIRAGRNHDVDCERAAGAS